VPDQVIVTAHRASRVAAPSPWRGRFSRVTLRPTINERHRPLTNRRSDLGRSNLTAVTTLNPANVHCEMRRSGRLHR